MGNPDPAGRIVRPGCPSESDAWVKRSARAQLRPVADKGGNRRSVVCARRELETTEREDPYNALSANGEWAHRYYLNRGAQLYGCVEGSGAQAYSIVDRASDSSIEQLRVCWLRRSGGQHDDQPHDRENTEHAGLSSAASYRSHYEFVRGSSVRLLWPNESELSCVLGQARHIRNYNFIFHEPAISMLQHVSFNGHVRTPIAGARALTTWNKKHSMNAIVQQRRAALQLEVYRAPPRMISRHGYFQNMHAHRRNWSSEADAG